MKKVYCYVIIVLLTVIGCVNKDELTGGGLGQWKSYSEGTDRTERQYPYNGG